MASEARDRTVDNCFTETFGYVAYLKKICARRQPEFATVKATLDRLIEQSAQRMRTWGIDPRSYDDARFAVFAWVDETILTMPWSQREEWRRNLLQTAYYSTTSAGSEFFERLNRLRSDQEGVREVYFTCLSLGFRGRYHQEGDEFLLAQLKKSNLKSVLGSVREPASFADEQLFAEAYQTQLAAGPSAQKPKFWTLPHLLLSVAPPLFLVLLFVIYTFVLNGVLDNLLTHVGGGRG
ncbi:MAG TPA: DotU family type IV/VI secretion system protein [Deferrisomatales bacterium]|nr:DotU family type IV/VI secretion system protein [Deferrisomatales bacterium]